ncbi:MAG TPA: thiamine-phosphate kinase [Actinomycetota bacterium]|nr:thiamine-phosphate kinase [Actinomycetota bacterium]
MTVSDAGEEALLLRILERAPHPPEGEVWAGDDAAALATPSTGRLLVTTDMLVEGVDFSLDHFSGGDIGWKCAAVNISDIAAMGGIASHVVVSLGLPGDAPQGLFEGILDGILDMAASCGVALIGGDLSSAAEVVISATALGRARGRFVTRSGAREGDVLCVTGSLGGAAAGLGLLRGGIAGDDMLDNARRRQLRPSPRTEEGPLLAELGATAMIDLSDGLARDLARLARASGVGCSIEASALPVDPAAAAASSILKTDATSLAVTGGEDYELLVALPEDRLDDAVSEMEGRSGLSVLGALTSDRAISIAGRAIESWEEEAWQHFRSQS